MSVINSSPASGLITTLVKNLLSGKGADVDQAGVWSSLLDQLPALLSVVDAEGRVVSASRHHTRLWGTPDHVEDIRHQSDLFPAAASHRVQSAPVMTDPKDKNAYWELSVRHKSGAEHVYRMLKLELTCELGTMHCLTGVDVTQSKLEAASLRDQKQRMDYAAYHDPLTGLANRTLFYERVHQNIASARITGNSFAILLIDLDRFKKVNDSLGHDAGDAYLGCVAQQLRDVVRPTDTTARLGGDEFVVVLENIHNPKDVEKLAKALLSGVSRSVRVQGHDISSSASIGISIYPQDGTAADQLLKHADQAMYYAKAAGKNRFDFFRRSMDDSAVDDLLLENDLRCAIEKNELTLHYQPQIDLQTGEIVGLEALVRWNHKTRGMVPPVHFIPLAEDTGLIGPLGEWVLREACGRFRGWLDQGINFGRIAVNLSAKQFAERDLEKMVSAALADTGLTPEYLELEITESSVMTHPGETVAVLKALSRLGVSLAIDDFGTGYSSLAYLKRFPFQKLKIDRAFIQEVDTQAESVDAAIAQTIIDLARNMKVQVLAEGVERPTQSAWLLDRGCNHAQGFLYARPMDEEHLMKLISDGKADRESDGVRLRIAD